VVVRVADPGLPFDAERMAGIHAECFSDAWDAVALYGLLQDAGVSGLIDDAGDGFALLRVAADEAEILTLAVTSAARRQGLARALLARAIAAAQAAGAQRMFLEVAAANAAGRALYAGAGFVQTGRRARYYPDGDDALVLSRSLA
jgi:ribosomal-protein-alanine N-acetyltransferase